MVFRSHKHPCGGGEEAVPRAPRGFMQNQSRAIYEIPAATLLAALEGGIAAEFMGVHLFMCVPD